MQALRPIVVLIIVAGGLTMARGQAPDTVDYPAPQPREVSGFSAITVDDRIEPVVYAELEASSDGWAYVIVVLRPVGTLDPDRLGEHQDAVRERQDIVLARLGPDRFVPVYQYENFAVVTGYVDAEGLARLAGDPDVLVVGQDAQGHSTLAESAPFIAADQVHDLYCYTGEGITVAVLDSGVDTGHPDLIDNLAPDAWHFLDQGANWGPGAEDDHGHGTNVAGIITSAGLVAPRGVAPDADILPVKVLKNVNGKAVGFVSDWIAGVNYVISKQGNYARLSVINMSLGTEDLFANCPCDHDTAWNWALQTALQRAKDVGIVTFAASGNNGSWTSMCSPACLSAATAVAAVYDSNYGPQQYQECQDPVTHPDLITCFSNRSPCNELAAPGFSITAPGMGGGTSTFTGTSQATPHCSGVAALMLESDAAGLLMPDSMVQILKETAWPTVDPGATNPNPKRVDAMLSVDVAAKLPTTEKAELLASDGAAGDWFGYSVAIDGETAVIGARLDNNQNGTAAGAAYVLCFDGWNWVERAKLTASDGMPYDEFGCSVAISGDTVVVGVPEDEHNGVKCGSAYVFVEPPGGWVSMTETSKLIPSDGAGWDGFGCSVAIAHDRVLVGSAWDDNSNGNGAGAVYAFKEPLGGWGGVPSPIIETAKLLAADSNGQYTDDRFGISVSMSGGLFAGYSAIIGADCDDDRGNNAGAAYVFGVDMFDKWVQGAKLLATDSNSQYAGDSFGCSVAICRKEQYGGAFAVVGAKFDDDMGSSAGSAYVFYAPPVGPPLGWFLLGRLLAPDGAAGDQFGYSVDISQSNNVVVGSPNDDDLGNNCGSAYLFRFWTEGAVVWTGGCYQTAKLLASDGAAGDHFGDAVALSGDRALIGAQDHGHFWPSAGSAYVFGPLFDDCNGNGFPDSCDILMDRSDDCDGNGIPDECEGSKMPWLEDFDSYVNGSGMHGQGCWKGWDNDPAFDAVVTSAQARSAPHAVDIKDSADLVRRYYGLDSGRFTFTAYVHVPTEMNGQSYFILLNTYPAGQNSDWSLQIEFDGAANLVRDFPYGTAPLPLVKGAWTQVRVLIDLDRDEQRAYYNGDLLVTKSWSAGVEPGGAINIAAVDLFANGFSSVYYDDLMLRLTPIGDLNCDSKVDFGDINPFVLALTNPAGYATAFPECDITNADINGDGKVDFGDINPFVGLLTSP